MSSAPQLRGRDEERQHLTTAISQVARGQGLILLVEGEAGIGKTRLLDEVTALAAAQGVAARRGTAEELEQGRPFGALLEALGGVAAARPALGDVSAEEARYLAQDAIVEHVESLTAEGPLALVVDDLHWADRATLSTVWNLARATRQSALLLVLAFRPSPRSPELERVIDGCTELGCRHLRLQPLDERALADLAAEIVGCPAGPGLLDQLRGARGNPFVGIELLRVLVAENALEQVGSEMEVRASGLPPALRHSLLRRLTALQPGSGEMLRVAAVLGSGRVEDVAAITGSSVGEVSELVREAARAGLLDENADRLVFRHDLIREALYDDLPEAARIALHASAASALDGVADPGVVARHLALGAVRDDPTVVEQLRRAGDRMLVAAPDAAAQVLARALELEPRRAARAEIAAELAHAQLGVGRAADAGEIATAALEDAATPTTVARLHLARAEACSHQGRVADALAAFGAALASEALSPAAAAAALGRHAEVRLWTYALDEAAAEAERALEAGRRLGLPAVITEALVTRSGVQQFSAHLDAAVESGREAVVAAANHPDALRRTPHAYLGLALLADDRLDEARAVGLEGRKLSADLGQVLVLPNYYALLARVEWFAGRWDDAVAEVGDSAALAEDFGLGFATAANEGIRGLIAFHRGDHDTARAVLAQHQSAGRGATDDAAGSELLVLLQARLVEADGDAPHAAKILLQLFEGERALGMHTARIWPGPDCARILSAAGERTAARDVAEDLAGIAARAGTPSSRGAAAMAQGFVDGDAEALSTAAAYFAEAGRPLDELHAWEAAADLLAAGGGTDESVTALERALELTDGLGAQHDAGRVTASLRALGVRRGVRGVRARPRIGWESLTDAELKVAALAAEGLTNLEIADRLYVSRRTVSTHLSHIFAKLGLRSRVELATEVLKRTG